MKTIIKGLAFCVAICCFAMAATNVATTAAINGKVEMVQTARDNIQIPDAAQCVQTSSMSMNRIGAGINIAFVGEKKSDQNFAAIYGDPLYCLGTNIAATAKDVCSSELQKTDCAATMTDIGKSDQSNIVYFSPAEIVSQNNIATAMKQTDNSIQIYDNNGTVVKVCDDTIVYST